MRCETGGFAAAVVLAFGTLTATPHAQPTHEWEWRAREQALQAGPLPASPPRAAATPAAAYAARLVDPAHYEHIHRDWLYTRDGDDRGFGPEHDLARNNIAALFESYGLLTQLHEFSYGGKPHYNVVAEQPGTTRPDEIYIVGAHYDSVSNPGADDNASGVAAVLEMARILSQWPSEATIRYMAYDREEQGLHGAAAYANQHRHEDIRGMISLDMVAFRRLAHGDAHIMGRAQSTKLKEALHAALAQYGGVSAKLYGPCDCSDHAPFEWNGFQAGLLIESDSNFCYHQQCDSSDTLGYIDYEYAAHLTMGALGWLVDAAGVQPDAPLGDLNCDYLVDAGDINPFVLALGNPSAYQAAYPDCDIRLADWNLDGRVDFDDINPFVAGLQGSFLHVIATNKLLAPDGEARDEFGRVLVADGPWAAIGVPEDDDLGNASGSVYLLHEAGGAWNFSTKLLAADGEANDRFGAALVITDDTLVVGAPYDDDRGDDAGAVYIFTWDGAAWTQTAKLTAADGVPGQLFGAAVSLDADALLIGATSETGGAYIFQRAGQSWSQTDKLIPSLRVARAEFGAAVALSGDKALVGAPGDDELGASSGSVYVFEQAADGWHEREKLTASDGRATLGFGRFIVVDGPIAVITGAARFLTNPPRSHASAYVFELKGNTWTETTRLGSWPEGRFFWSAYAAPAPAVRGDTVVIGRSTGNWGTFSGAAYVFKRSGDDWQQIAEVAPTDGVAGDWFGAAATLTDRTLLIGASLAGDLGTYSGSVYTVDLLKAGIAPGRTSEN